MRNFTSHVRRNDSTSTITFVRIPLTWAGRVFLEDVRRVFTALDQAKTNVQAPTSGYHGTLRVRVRSRSTWIAVFGHEARTGQSVRQQVGNPRGIMHIGLATWHVLNV